MNNQYLPPVIAIPSALEISAISQSYPMVITVSSNTDQENTYIAGQAIRLNVPYVYRMFQANGLTGVILDATSNHLTVDIDSTLFDPFVPPTQPVLPPYATEPATIAPAGSRNLQYNNTTGQVPFQSLNNIGN